MKTGSSKRLKFEILHFIIFYEIVMFHVYLDIIGNVT